MNRDDYLKYGFEPVEFDETRAFTRVEVAAKDLPSGTLPKQIAQVMGMAEDLPPPTEGEVRFEDNPSYDYRQTIRDRAQAAQPSVAPTVTWDDLPAFIPVDRRNDLFKTIHAMDVRMDVVSLNALEVEATPHHHYWDHLSQDCWPILQKAQRTMNKGLETPSKKDDLDTIEKTALHLRGRLNEPDQPIGDPLTGSVLIRALFLPEAQYTREEKEILLGHAIGNARMGNRAARQYATLADKLPPEAHLASDVILTDGSEVEVMHEVNRRKDWSKEDFLEHSSFLHAHLAEHVSSQAEAQSWRGAGVKAAGLRKAAKEVASMPHSAPDIFERHGRINQSLFEALSPDHYHKDLIGFEMSRAQMVDREKLRSRFSVSGKSSDEGRS
jgi:hypothetical protein